MQAIEQVSGANQFEVVLYFEGNTWLFSTGAHAARMHEALEHAEREFSIHSRHHRLDSVRATSAYVFDAAANRHFTKRDGRWQLSESGDLETPSCNSVPPRVTTGSAAALHA